MEHLAPLTSNSVPEDRVAALAREMRSAVLAADHTRADLLVKEYAETLSAFWESMPEDEREASELPQVSLELLAWARQATLIHRALTTEQLDVLQKASRYQTTGIASALQVNG
jgi:hypothetical protein